MTTELYVLGAILIPLLLGLGGMVWKVRINDIRHLHQRFDRLEKKIDDHIQWHLTRGEQT